MVKAKSTKVKSPTSKAKKASRKPKWDKNDPRGPRPSPTECAKEFEVGLKKEGNDGLPYEVAENKIGNLFWKKVKVDEGRTD